MFRIQNNVPEVYVQESRDFQLFCRLYDTIFGGTKFEIDSMIAALNPHTCNERVLELLKTTVGLFTELDLTDAALRYVIEAFPKAIRYKGSIYGIRCVLNLYQRIMGDVDCEIKINERELSTNKRLLLEFSKSVIIHDTLLRALLWYIIPTGFEIEYRINSNKPFTGSILTTDTVTFEQVDNISNSTLPDGTSQRSKSSYHNSVSLTEIPDFTTDRIDQE